MPDPSAAARTAQAMVDDLMVVVRDALKDQTVNHVTRLFAMTAPEEGSTASFMPRTRTL